ncbi:hypothetical protein PVAP13_6NG297400 [Panicum virgatum]|uniref:Uncharacterized protein n=1 Tax=Panicum virgatum TaxID=38727 RepID=A0A8T0R4D4_PANVG|nr:hypothetical protein PVAP13_6NG297400 [Panicum virgatum]
MGGPSDQVAACTGAYAAELSPASPQEGLPFRPRNLPRQCT